MSDTYQAVYDAVRSRVSNIDSSAIERVASEAFDISYVKQRLMEAASTIEMEMIRPSVLFRPMLAADGTSWMALLGDDLQSGVAGFGDTPAAAMAAFDQAFWKERTPAARLTATTSNAA